jgi:demethylmenaquinone methyltransferase/2-methoxy-6-polyprenyl-1,4-benzoquinol methylase
MARGLPGNTRILGMDFCAPMLVEAEAKRARLPQVLDHVQFQQGDALNLPAAEASYDAVTIAFGLRNMADRPRCLSEIRRVLRPAGHLFVLEFSRPWALVRPMYDLHVRLIAPAVAGLLTGDRAAYEYLGSSIAAFPGREALSGEIRAAGFADVAASSMTMGVVALHVARRGASVS